MTLLSLTRTAPTFARLHVARFEISKAPVLQNIRPMLVDCVSPLYPPHIGYDYFHYSMKSTKKREWERT